VCGTPYFIEHIEYPLDSRPQAIFSMAIPYSIGLFWPPWMHAWFNYVMFSFPKEW